MAQDKALFIKIDEDLKNHVNQYIKDRPQIKGGLSGMIKRFLVKTTKYKA